MNEAPIENYLKEQLERNGLGYCRKFVSPGVRGVPDRICILSGNIKEFVECKSTKGKKSGFQNREIKRYRGCGHKVYIINSKEKVDIFVKKMKEKIMNKFFDYWKKVEITNKTNQKKIILKDFIEDFPILKSIFFYAYNPYFNFGVKNLTLEGRGMGFINFQTFLFLEKLNSRVYTGNTAREKLLAQENILTRRSCIILNRILKGDLRLGINVKTINSLEEKNIIPTFDVMLAKEVDWDRVIYPCFASVKKDGDRCIIIGGRVLSRTGKEYKGVDHILRELKENKSYNPKMKLDGEIIVPGDKFDESSGKIRSHENTPEAEFWVFDIMNTNWSFEKRLARLKQLKSEHINYITHVRVDSEEVAKDIFKLHLSMGEEGLIIKPIDYQYEKKRSYNWMKVKEQNTIDLECIDFYEGTGKYVGLLGGVIVELNGKRVRVSGFNEKLKKEIWFNKDKYLGLTVEVKYQNATEKGSLRHPRFLRFRYDK